MVRGTRRIRVKSFRTQGWRGLRVARLGERGRNLRWLEAPTAAGGFRMTAVQPHVTFCRCIPHTDVPNDAGARPPGAAKT